MGIYAVAGVGSVKLTKVKITVDSATHGYTRNPQATVGSRYASERSEEDDRHMCWNLRRSDKPRLTYCAAVPRPLTPDQ